MKQEINIFDYLIDFVSQNKLYYIFYLLLIPITSIIQNYIIPELLGEFYTKISAKYNYLLYYISISIVLFNYLHVFINWLAWRTTPEFYQYVVIRLYDYIYSNSYCNYENLDITEIIVKISKMPWIFHAALKTFKEEFCNVFFGAIVGIFYFYYKLGIKYLIVFLIFFISMIVLQIINIKHISEINQLKEKIGDKSFQKLSESLTNIGVVQSFQNIEYEKKIIYSILNNYNNIYYSSLNNSIVYDIITKTLNCLMGIILGYMVWTDYLKGKLNKQYLFQCSQVILLLIKMCDYIGIVSRSISDNLGQIYDMNLFFNKEIPFDKTCRIGKSMFNNGDIVFKNIYHKYDKRYAIEGVSLTIRRGEKIALIGESGSGKSTMIKLLMKHKFLLMGSITIGGINVNQISSKELSNHIMYIPQNPKLFNRPLYDNIIYGLKKPPTKEKILEALESMNMSSISKVFSEKMNMNVGIDGTLLSGGQRQIVWLLRSLYRMKPIIILDEPTAALDVENKKMVIDTIKKIGIGKTIIVISHDDIDSEFRKVIFNNGRIVEEGGIFSTIV